MTDLCSAAPQAAGFVSSVTAYIDCQAQTLGSGSWQALASPGSTLTIVLTAFLTIFIALIGYNLLLGQGMTVRSGTLAFVKIGMVFALATSWPAYRTLVYDLVVDGPGQLVSEIGPRAGIVGSNGTLLQRLDLADQALAELAVLGAGPLPPDLQDSSGTYVPPPPFAGFNAFALGGAKILFELTAISALGIVRIISGLMLALGPFFIAFLMFDSTRSLFEGWVRVLAGAALAAVGVSIALGLELAFMEPWLSTVLARRMAGEAIPTVATELFVITCLFAIIVTAALYACTRVARAFRLPPFVRIEQSVNTRAPAANPLATSPQRADTQSGAEAERSRAAAVASVLVAMNRREIGASTLAVTGSSQSVRVLEPRASVDEPARRTVPLGHSFNRRPGSRASASAARRDSAT
jgi:type IV secretion system protein VirB6